MNGEFAACMCVLVNDGVCPEIYVVAPLENGSCNRLRKRFKSERVFLSALDTVEMMIGFFERFKVRICLIPLRPPAPTVSIIRQGHSYYNIKGKSLIRL